MAKSTNVGIGNKAAKAAVKAPSAPVVSKSVAPKSAPAQVPPAPAPAASAPAPAPVPTAPQSPKGTHGGVPLENLPKSLKAKGESLGILPASIGVFLVKQGRVFKATSAHNQKWADRALEILKANPVATTADLVQGGVPAHSVNAYLKRGWLVKV